MNIKEIQDLIKFVAKSGVNEVQIEQKEFKITIRSEEKSASDKQIIVQATTPVAATVAIPATVPVAAAPAAPAAEEESNLVTIKSPMIGTFYRSAGPDKPTFVGVGDSVSPDSTVCIIEAMKLFNEIESEVTGKIVKVLVDDATPVEYDQPLFLVEPA